MENWNREPTGPTVVVTRRTPSAVAPPKQSHLLPPRRRPLSPFAVERLRGRDHYSAESWALWDESQAFVRGLYAEVESARAALGGTPAEAEELPEEEPPELSLWEDREVWSAKLSLWRAQIDRRALGIPPPPSCPPPPAPKFILAHWTSGSEHDGLPPAFW